MSVHLKDYVPLIQLLIGSTFFVLLFQKEDFLSSIRDKFDSTISLENYQIVSRDDWTKRLSALRRPLMLILIVYGCMILYYCANFKLIETTTLLDSEKATIENPYPSLFGIAFLSLIVSIYQALTFIRPISRMNHRKSKTICWGYIIVMVIVFSMFILLFPNNHADDMSCFFEKKLWVTDGKRIWEKIVNSWVLINLLLWIIIYIHIYNKVKVLTYKLTTDDGIINHLGIEDRLKYILLERLPCDQDRFKRRYLKKRAEEELKKDNSYFNEEDIRKILTNNSQFKLLALGKDDKENEQLATLLKRIIDNSNLSCHKKRKLKKIVKYNPTYNFENNSLLGNLKKEKEEISKKDADRLCNCGFLDKIETKGKKRPKFIIQFRNLLVTIKRMMSLSFSINIHDNL